MSEFDELDDWFDPGSLFGCDPVEFPITGSNALSIFVASPYGGGTWSGRPSAGDSFGRDLSASGVPAPSVGPLLNGRASADFDPDASGAVDPATGAWALLWRASYAGAPWPGTASLGSSGARDAIEGVEPDEGSPANGYVPAEFDGTTTYLVDPTTEWDEVASTTYKFVIVFRARSAPTATADLYECASFLADDSSSAVIGIGITDDGVQMWHLASGTRWIGVVAPCPADGELHIARGRFTGSTFELAIDDEEWVVVAADPEDDVPVALDGATIRIGLSWNGSRVLDGDIFDIMAAPDAGTLEELDGIKAGVYERYGFGP